MKFSTFHSKRIVGKEPTFFALLHITLWLENTTNFLGICQKSRQWWTQRDFYIVNSVPLYNELGGHRSNRTWLTYLVFGYAERYCANVDIIKFIVVKG